jgi:phosphohistidine phosphatase SixA
MRMLLSLLLALAFGAGNGLAAADGLVVVVRHAEKANDDPRNPSLSDLGQARAASLAKALAGYPVTTVLVSEYRRTLLTAEPTLRDHQLTARVVPVLKDSAELYGRRIADLVHQELRGGVILLVSHSHTVPAVVFALTGVQVPPIIESSEFDRLYIISLPAQGEPRIISARY